VFKAINKIGILKIITFYCRLLFKSGIEPGWIRYDIPNPLTVCHLLQL
jgi:hypothetical protein